MDLSGILVNPQHAGGILFESHISIVWRAKDARVQPDKKSL